MQKKISPTQQVGYKAEEAASHFLIQQKLILIEKNFCCNMGEIDLIMQDKNTLVFIEVRLRQHPQFATGLESVDQYKQAKLRRAAEYYLQKKQLSGKLPCRFDVIAATRQTDAFTFDWIKNAF